MLRTTIIPALVAGVWLCAAPIVAHAQYYNTDGGRPGRIEDATPTARRSIDVDFTGIQMEWLKGGTSRYRFDPGVSWGILSRTEIGIRAPLVRVKPPTSTRNRGAAGLAGLAVGGMYALTLETPTVPAIAFGTELLLPVGKLAAPRTSYVMKALASKRFAFGRVHVNAGAGAYSVQLGGKLAVDSSCADDEGSDAQSGCGNPPIIVDLPCNAIPASNAPLATGARANRYCMAQPSSQATQAVQPFTPRSHGTRWFAGAGIDHAFALQSTLISADIVVEKFEGLFSAVDQTLEAGIRHQFSPLAMVDAGFGWRYAGTTRSFSVSVGTTLELAWPLVHRGAPK